MTDFVPKSHTHTLSHRRGQMRQERSCLISVRADAVDSPQSRGAQPRSHHSYALSDQEACERGRVRRLPCAPWPKACKHYTDASGHTMCAYGRYKSRHVPRSCHSFPLIALVAVKSVHRMDCWNLEQADLKWSVCPLWW